MPFKAIAAYQAGKVSSVERRSKRQQITQAASASIHKFTHQAAESHALCSYVDAIGGMYSRDFLGASSAGLPPDGRIYARFEHLVAHLFAILKKRDVHFERWRNYVQATQRTL